MATAGWLRALSGVSGKQRPRRAAICTANRSFAPSIPSNLGLILTPGATFAGLVTCNVAARLKFQALDSEGGISPDATGE